MSQAVPSRIGPRSIFLLFSLVTLLALPIQGRAETPADSPNITISGFISYSYNFLDQLGEGSVYSPAGTEEDETERHFDLLGEIDVNVQWDWASARFDLNIPGDGNETPSLFLVDDADVGIEQARFDIMPPFGKDFNFTITGGAFNSPIGLEHQDPDQKHTISDSFQFDLVPSNLLGISLSGGSERFSLNAILANEWRTDEQGELSYGLLGKIGLAEKLSLSMGALWSTAGVEDDSTYNVVASTGFIPWVNLDLEGTLNENNYALGATMLIANPEHTDCGAVVRLEKLWADATSEFTQHYYDDNPGIFRPVGVIGGAIPANDHEFSNLSLTLFTHPLRHLKLEGEGRVTRVQTELPTGSNDFYTVAARAVYSF